ncbi:hypothetical protein ATANTOWER_032102 [Ataeniobius toweri]|uniref:Uncharacterized protein n=1 Tax=Ataeniobius toweri TaxID=208326 RepID=A0ABU7CA89_9TELE|nr:hypothetical protein [Ataeniobius toweri]
MQCRHPLDLDLYILGTPGDTAWWSTVGRLPGQRLDHMARTLGSMLSGDLQGPHPGHHSGVLNLQFHITLHKVEELMVELLLPHCLGSGWLVYTVQAFLQQDAV